jgi:hypothetical protein
MVWLDGASAASGKRSWQESAYSLRPLLQTGYAGRGADSAVMDFRAAAVDADGFKRVGRVDHCYCLDDPASP